jgi:predicted ATPase/DNA-binding XRE family transcriptional regulator
MVDSSSHWSRREGAAMEQMRSFGYWVRRRRKALDLTQEALAQQVGCALATIKKIEADERRPSLAMAERIARCLAVPPAERATFLKAARVTLADLPADVSPLENLAVPGSNLPAQPTTLIGREQELHTLRALLLRADVRLVTLIGPGGVGKTRLALHVAAELREAFADGVCFVPLAALGEPTLVAATIAQTLGVRETAGQPLVVCLTAALQARHMLLVLDNFEHVVGAASLLATLMAAPRLTLLVTSRAVLHVYGECEFAVAPLALPAPAQLPPLVELAQYPAVGLFLARAQAVKPTYTLTDEDAPAIVAICRRLDGLPLAIELAAAWVKLFTLQALLGRLDHRLTLLTGGARDRPAHQQTLRAAITWSDDLLTAPEQMLFRRLAVFGGPYTLEAAAAVCTAEANPPIAMLHGLMALVDQSLIRQVEDLEGEPRFTMLETIREYALEGLLASGEAEALRSRHASYYHALVERAEPELRGPQQIIWLERLEAEHDNLRAALGWLLQGGEIAAGQRMAGALWRFWHGRGYLSEGRKWLEGGVAAVTAHSPARARALYGAGMMAFYQSDMARAAELYAASLAVCRAVDDQAGIASALERLGWLAADHGQVAQARTTLEESLARFRALDDRHGMATSLAYLGEVLRTQADDAGAAHLLGESLALSRALKDTRGSTLPLLSLGTIARFQGDYARALAYFEESLTLSRAVQDKHTTATSLRNLGAVTHLQGDETRATRCFEASLVLFEELGDRYCGAATMSDYGRMAYDQGDAGRASRLCEASIAVFRELGVGNAIVAASLGTLGSIALTRNDDADAAARFSESLALAWEAGAREEIARGLAGLARVAGMIGQLERAVRLWGTAHAFREASGAPPAPADQVDNERALATTRKELDALTFATAWAAGQAMPFAQAITEGVLANDRPKPAPRYAMVPVVKKQGV